MKIVFSKKYDAHQESISQIIREFDTKGKVLGEDSRNTIKLFKFEGRVLNIKSFKTPNLINKIVYRFFRKSKAERSFRYANYLLENEILTPYPIAFAQSKSGLFFGRSFYVSEHLDYDLTYRELIRNSDYVGDEKLLSAFAKFTFTLHEKNIQFLDHSPGNTLIRLTKREPEFYLVDLNRMKFGKLSFAERMQNFARLSPIKVQVEIMANTYATLIGKPKEVVFEAMWQVISSFQDKFQRKKRWKKRFKI